MNEINLEVEPEAKNKLLGLKIGCILFKGANVENGNSKVDQAIAEASENVKTRFSSPENLAHDSVLKGMRRLFSSIGIDPTKERPSGEALIRRILNDKGLYRINSVVDLNNVVSMLGGYPCGVYNFDKIKGTVTVTIGKEGDSYIGITGNIINASNKLVTQDELGIFGAPTADSSRTAITKDAKSILMLIYAPPEASEADLKEAIEKAKQIMTQGTGATPIVTDILEIR